MTFVSFSSCLGFQFARPSLILQRQFQRVLIQLVSVAFTLILKISRVLLGQESRRTIGRMWTKSTRGISGQLLVCSLDCSHFSLIRFLCIARTLRCAHSFARCLAPKLETFGSMNWMRQFYTDSTHSATLSRLSREEMEKGFSFHFVCFDLRCSPKGRLSTFKSLEERPRMISFSRLFPSQHLQAVILQSFSLSFSPSDPFIAACFYCCIQRCFFLKI